jgi:eukaryotic-like serine/threonine-protein kinase
LATSRRESLVYEFGPFCLDVADRLLLKQGEPVPLAPKALDTLVVLVENSGRIVGKGELLDTIWPDTFVEEVNLTVHISALRKALGEDHADPVYIETIPRRGYRFVSRVTAVHRVEDEILLRTRTGARILIEENEEDDAAGPSSGSQAPGVSNAVVGQNLSGVHPLSSPAGGGSLSRVLRHKKKAFALLAVVALVSTAAIVAYENVRVGRARGRPFGPSQRVDIRKVTASGNASRSAISPDGKFAVYALEQNGHQGLWLRQLETTSEVQVVPPLNGKVEGLTFSLDGQFIYYVLADRVGTPGTLYRVPVLGGTVTRVLERVDSPITFSPDGERIAFVRNEAVQKESLLMIFDLGTSEETGLAQPQRPNRFSTAGPAWSPDGNTIVSSLERRDSNIAYVQMVCVRVSDGEQSPLGSWKWAWAGQASWLGDGRGVIVNAWDNASPVVADQLWVVSYPAGEVRRLTGDLMNFAGLSLSTSSNAILTTRSDRVSGFEVLRCDESPGAETSRSSFGDPYSEMLGLTCTRDGRIVYGSQAGGNCDIWIMNADGTGRRQLTTGRQIHLSPNVSPDGRFVVYVTYADGNPIASPGSGPPSIWRMDLDGANPTRLTHGSGEDSPSISPDGAWVVYTSYGADADKRIPTIWKVPLTGGDPVQLTKSVSYMPVVSPDGRQIACYYYHREVGGTGIALIPFEGGEPVRFLDEMPAPDWNTVRWSPDGRALTFIHTENGISNLLGKTVDAGPPRPLTDFKSGRIFRFAWLPDGKRLVCERGISINDVVLITSIASPD